MKIIGICGQSGSGKSTVCRLLAEKGIPILDCDAIYHELVERDTPCLRAIGDRFGHRLIQGGALDRAALREIVYTDPAELSALNHLSHRFVMEECDRRIDDLKRQNASVCVIDAPLFFEAGLEKKCDFVVAVIVSRDIQLQRLQKRDQISVSDASLRLEHQTSQEDLQKRADYLIFNNGSMAELEKECDRLLAFVLDHDFACKTKGRKPT